MAQSLDWLDGFDDYAIADLPIEGWSVGAGAGGFGAGRVAGSAYTVSLNSATTKACTADNHPHVAFAWKTGNAATAAIIIELREGATVHGRLSYNGNGTFTLSRAGSIPATSANLGIVAGTFYHIELDYYIHDTAGLWELRVESAAVIGPTTTLDTRNGGTAGVCDTIGIFSAGTGQAFDDFLYYIGAGASAGAFAGDCRVLTNLATGDGAAAAWTPSTGSSHSALVDDATENGDTDYVSSAGVGNRDLYTFGSLGVTGTVLAVGVRAVARKTDAGARTLGLTVRVGSTNYDHGSTDLPLTTYAPFGTTQGGHGIYETNPAGGSWSIAAVNGAEAGVKDVA